MVSLRSFSLFDPFGASDLSKLESLCQKRALAAGETLFFEGDSATALYIIASGEIEISRCRNGDTSRIAILSTSDTVGEMAFFDPAGARGLRNADARALTDVVLIVILADALAALGTDEPMLVRRLESIIRERKNREPS
ncbi:MAG TPA: cyclic nucleotide-binding domain-containing protein [bacterium]|nr:cyclic nucleotide-binding domain-containing protein [bacterium]